MDIFLADDTHQRICGHRVSLKQVGIDLAGRSERLKINYRTTAEMVSGPAILSCRGLDTSIVQHISSAGQQPHLHTHILLEPPGCATAQSRRHAWG